MSHSACKGHAVRSWAIHDRGGKFLFHITASSADEALAFARQTDRTAWKAVLVIDREQRERFY